MQLETERLIFRSLGNKGLFLDGGRKMHIEHVAMFVNDLERSKEFFVEYFEAVVENYYCNEKKQFQSYFLSFDNGARLEIMTKGGCNKDSFEGKEQGGYGHIAFHVGSKEKVDELTLRLSNDGYRVISGPRYTGDGYYESLFLDDEGNAIEITC